MPAARCARRTLCHCKCSILCTRCACPLLLTRRACGIIPPSPLLAPAPAPAAPAAQTPHVTGPWCLHGGHVVSSPRPLRNTMRSWNSMSSFVKSCESNMGQARAKGWSNTGFKVGESIAVCMCVACKHTSIQAHAHTHTLLMHAHSRSPLPPIHPPSPPHRIPGCMRWPSGTPAWGTSTPQAVQPWRSPAGTQGAPGASGGTAAAAPARRSKEHQSAAGSRMVGMMGWRDRCALLCWAALRCVALCCVVSWCGALWWALCLGWVRRYSSSSGARVDQHRTPVS